MVFLPCKPGGHDNARFARRIGMLVRLCVGLKPDAVGDGQRLRGIHATGQQRLAHALRDAHDGLGAARQPKHLCLAPARIAFARVVLDLYQARHARDQPGIAPPKVLAESVRHQQIGPKFATQAHQLPNGGSMGPAWDHLYRQALRTQGGDAHRIGLALAPQHQQGVKQPALTMRPHQIHGHLRGTGKATGDEMQYARQFWRHGAHWARVSETSVRGGKASSCRSTDRSAAHSSMSMNR